MVWCTNSDIWTRGHIVDISRSYKIILHLIISEVKNFREKNTELLQEIQDKEV